MVILNVIACRGRASRKLAKLKGKFSSLRRCSCIRLRRTRDSNRDPRRRSRNDKFRRHLDGAMCSLCRRFLGRWLKEIVGNPAFGFVLLSLNLPSRRIVKQVKSWSRRTCEMFSLKGWTGAGAGAGAGKFGETGRAVWPGPTSAGLAVDGVRGTVLAV